MKWCSRLAHDPFCSFEVLHSRSHHSFVVTLVSLRETSHECGKVCHPWSEADADESNLMKRSWTLQLFLDRTRAVSVPHPINSSLPAVAQHGLLRVKLNYAVTPLYGYIGTEASSSSLTPPRSCTNCDTATETRTATTRTCTDRSSTFLVQSAHIPLSSSGITPNTY